MDDLLALFRTASDEFGARVHAVTEEQWSAATPDTEWTVADLVKHLIDEHRWMPPLLHGLDLDSAEKVVAGTRDLPVDGGVGANLAESWDEAATASRAATAEEDALQRTVTLSRGDTPAEQYVAEMTFDAIVHAWDLGKAIGFSEPLPEELVVWAWEQVPQLDDLAATGLFAPPVEVAEDAPLIDRLVAATGRQP
jgi:uncharacterized protein (TIGR03086 family)